MEAFIKHKQPSRLAIFTVLLLGGCATVPAPDAPKLAITIDDLPVHGPLPEGATALAVNRQMIRAITDARVQGVTVFVNGHWTESNPETAAALQAWTDAGIPVANHSWSHKSLDAVSADAFKDEITRNEPVLERYSGGRDWRWFRFPLPPRRRRSDEAGGNPHLPRRPQLSHRQRQHGLWRLEIHRALRPLQGREE